MADHLQILKIYLILVLFTLASCSSSGPISRSLSVAEKLMDIYPDSALIVLQSISPANLGSDRERALYGLLMTQALDKNYVDVTSDSLIRPAVNYYSDSSDKFHLMKSLYYLAGVEYYRKAYSESLIVSYRAYELAYQLDNKFWIGMTARRIADIYRDNYCTKEQIKFSRIALENFRQTNQTRFIHYGIYNLAAAYHANETYSRARQMSRELLDTAKVYGDDILKRQALELIGLGYMATDSLSAACDVFREILSLPTVEISDSAFYNSLCLRLHRMDDLVGDVPRLVASKKLPDDLSHWLQCQWYVAHDSVQQTFSMMRAVNRDTNRALKESRRQNIAGSLTDYHHHKESIDKINLRNAHIFTIIIIIVALIIICMIVTYARQRNLRQQILIDEYMTMDNELRSLLAETASELDKALSRTEDTNVKSDKVDFPDGHRSLALFEKYFHEFDAICRSFRRDTTATSNRRISDSVEKLIDSFSNGERLRELEDYANYRYGGIMTKLRTDFPKLKEIDYTIFLLSRLGFSIPTVALILKKDDDKMFVYNHRKLLKEKFREFRGANRESYIEVMP